MSRISEGLDPSPYRDGLPGHKEDTTSRLAAERIASKADALRVKVLAELEMRPGTADEIATDLKESVLSIRPRVSELRKQGRIRPLVEDGKQVRRRNASGASAIVWTTREEA